MHHSVKSFCSCSNKADFCCLVKCNSCDEELKRSGCSKAAAESYNMPWNRAARAARNWWWMQLATPLPIFMVLVKCTVLISVGTMSWRKNLSRTKKCFNQRQFFSSWFGVRAGAANVPPFRSRVGNTATNKKHVFLLKPPDFLPKIHAENYIIKTPLFRQRIFIQLLT